MCVYVRVQISFFIRCLWRFVCICVCVRTHVCILFIRMTFGGILRQNVVYKSPSTHREWTAKCDPCLVFAGTSVTAHVYHVHREYIPCMQMTRHKYHHHTYTATESACSNIKSIVAAAGCRHDCALVVLPLSWSLWCQANAKLGACHAIVEICMLFCNVGAWFPYRQTCICQKAPPASIREISISHVFSIQENMDVDVCMLRNYEEIQ